MKDFEMSITNDWVSCLAYSCRLSLAFIFLELFSNLVSYRKWIVIHLILIPRNEDGLCPSGDAFDY